MKKQDLLERVRRSVRSTRRSTLVLSLAAQELSEKAVKARQAELSALSKRIDKRSAWALVAVYVLVGALLLTWMGCTNDWRVSGTMGLVLTAMAWMGACVLLERASSKIVCCAFGLPLAALSLLDCISWVPHDTAPDAIAAFLVLMSAWIFAHGAEVLADKAQNSEAISVERDLLSSIAGTRWCLGVVENLKKGGEAASAWRDQAVTERGKLLRLDAEIIAALADRHIRDTNRDEEQAALDAACREAHGLA